MADPRTNQLENNVLDLALRVGRIESQLGLQLERVPSATFGQHAPAPDYTSERAAEPDEPEPCSCDEAVYLRKQVAKLECELKEWMAIAGRETRRADSAEYRAFGYRFEVQPDGIIAVTNDTTAAAK